MADPASDKRQTQDDPPEGRIRILLIEDHELVRDGLTALIDREQDLAVCGWAATATEAKRLLTQQPPDVISLDLMLDGIISIRLLGWLRQHYPDIPVLITSMYDESLYGKRALAAGAQGFVSKSAPANALLQAIRTVNQGDFYFSQTLVHEMMRHTGSGRPSTGPLSDVLTERELEVFCLIGEGRKTAEIATVLRLSPSTIETYRERLKHKLGIDNASQLSYAAICWMRDGELPQSTGDNHDTG